MTWHRIMTMLQYAWYHFTHSMETWVDIVWFPFIELLVFGLLAQLFAPTQPNVVPAIIIGLIFWEVLRAVQYSLTLAMLWDVWSRSFSTLFISPLTMSEFVIGQTLGGVGKAGLIFIFLSLLSLLFKVNILILGPVLVIYLVILSIFATFLGLLVMGMIIRFGTDIQSLAWSLIFMLQPISAVFYPVEALPEMVRSIAYISPITYLMESVRNQLNQGEVLWTYVLISLVLSLIYGGLMLGFFHLMYRRAQRIGSFARMDM